MDADGAGATGRRVQLPEHPELLNVVGNGNRHP